MEKIQQRILSIIISNEYPTYLGDKSEKYSLTQKEMQSM
jgi:hypothetical protein